jgi:ABC-type glycerol-3-phosphate transport system permease component
MAERIDGVFVELKASVDAAGVVSGEQKIVNSAKKIQNQFKTTDASISSSGRSIARQYQNSAKATGKFGRSAGMASIQVQQMVGQIQGGVNPMMALSQQGADLGIVLGAPLIGSIVGIAAAIGISLMPSLGDSKTALEKLEEAAEIDGCSKPQIFFQVVLPILKPIVVTVVILNAIWIWNDFLLPSLVLGVGQDVQTIPLAIRAFAGSFVKKWDLIMTAVLMAAAPIVTIFVFLQKHIIKGMVSGSIK